MNDLLFGFIFKGKYVSHYQHSVISKSLNYLQEKYTEYLPDFEKGSSFVDKSISMSVQIVSNNDLPEFKKKLVEKL